MTKRYFQKCTRCFGKAFEYNKKPTPDMEMSIGNVIHKDNPKAGDSIVCEKCNCNLLQGSFKEKYLIIE